jgi:tetratricopeptide (TPR) repeat protein
VLLERQGAIDGALAAYRRADERGDASGAFNLGLLLARDGLLDGARAAYRRAAERGDPDVQQRAAQAAADIKPDDDVTSHQMPPHAVPEVDATVEVAVSPTCVAPSQPSEAEAQLPAQTRVAESVNGRSVARASRRPWIAALCLLALFGLVAVLIRRGRRRSR